MKIGIGLGLTNLRASGFNPATALLPGAAVLAWHDPSDLMTMFQDRAGTAPVTAAGQTVGFIRDKGLGAFHLTAVSDAARGIYQTSGGLHWIERTGSIMAYATPTITPGVDKVQAFMAARKNSDAGRGVLFEFSPDLNTNDGTFTLEAPDANGANTYRVRSKGTAMATVSASGFVAPLTNVLTLIGDISGDTCALRANGAQVVVSATDQGAGNYGSHVMYMGARGGSTLPADWRLYGGIVRFSAANLDAGLIEQTERWLGAKAGLTW